MWKDIWERKGNISIEEDISLKQLIAINGFDTATGTLEENVWIDYVLYILNKINVGNGVSILEIGCGAGAFLSALKDILKNENITGVDYSESLIKIAKKVMPECSFYASEAKHINKLLESKNFDIIISNSVYNYFPNQEYALDVINNSIKILAKNGSIALLDLNDIKKESVYHSIRKGDMSREEYAKKYDGLDHLFFSKEDLSNLFRNYGFKDIIVEDQNIEGYKNSELRFNIFALNKK